jgi:hypothetical protein
MGILLPSLIAALAFYAGYEFSRWTRPDEAVVARELYFTCLRLTELEEEVARLKAGGPDARLKEGR